MEKSIIEKNLGNCLEDTSFLGLPGRKKGKVRDTYDIGSDKLIIITTDRQSAFDRVLANIPFKGQVLNLTSAFWFEGTKGIVPNHVVSIPDPNVTIAKKCEVLPVEFVMRDYLTGSTATSAWTQYNKGARVICGNRLPNGMVKNQRLSMSILTPTTKSDTHDESISLKEIVERGLVDKKTLNEAVSIVFQLFAYGQRIAANNGLILVDTKYELGIDQYGQITLIDEIHTPDSSRYWIAASYEERFAAGKEPENIDKEFLRLWFKDHCDPYNDPKLPKAPKELVVELASRYIRLYEMITGQQFQVAEEVDIKKRMRKNLCAYIL